MTGSVTLHRHADDIGELVFSNPARCNAMSMAMWDDLGRLLSDLEKTPVRALAVRGEGRDFCSGGDITEYETFAREPETARTYLSLYVELIRRLRTLPVPTIAAMDGAAVGAGLALATACDFRVATPDARISITAVKRGLVFPIEEIARLVGIVGFTVTRRILLRGRSYRAEDLIEGGFCEEIVPAETLRVRAFDMLGNLAQSPAQVLAVTKYNLALIEAGQPGETDQTLAMAQRAFEGEAFLSGTRDFLTRKASRGDTKKG